MSDASDSSDVETFDKQEDDKDTDFNIDDYGHEIDSDDSLNELPKTENNVNMEINKSQDNRYVGPVISGHRFDKVLLCVIYPGIVKNPDKAIETLGGLGSISTAVDANKRLELRFRPDDAYSKPACADRHNTTGFLLRVRVKKNKTQVDDVTTQNTKSKIINIASIEATTRLSVGKDEQPEDTSNTRKGSHEDDADVNNLIDQIHNCNVGSISKDVAEGKNCAADNNSSDAENLSRKKAKPFTFNDNKYENLSQDANYELPSLKILGRVNEEFKFINICDFQYTPMTQSKSNPEKLECIYSSIYPTGIPSYSWLRNDVPYFLPPAVFSRMDTVQQYIPKPEIDSSSENILGKSKKCQAGFSNFIHFSTPEVPSAAPRGIETAMKVKFLQNAHLEQVRQLFEERPIWSKNAIMFKTRFTSEQLKILLPSVAYYFMTGPWRVMWVKLGYDPRKDTNARKYQTLDYRLKAMHGLGSTIKCKRNYSNYTLPYKSAPVSKQKPAILSATLSQEQNPKKERHLNENVYIYREGMVPPSRQMFYQYCDVLVGEIQEMLAKLPDPLPGMRCHEKRGWLPTDFDVQCREILNKQVRAVLRKKMNIPEDHPTSLPRKRKHGIKLKINKTSNKRTKKK